MVYSTNQVRQFFVVKAYQSSVAALANKGDIALTKNVTDLYFTYKGADGTIRTDLIPLDRIKSIKATKYTSARTKLKEYTVTLSSDVNGGAPLAGQDYILGINFENWGGLSAVTSYYKDAAVHAYTGMTAATFYTQLATELTRNFKNEAEQVLSFTGTATGLVVKELKQSFIVGTYEPKPLVFTIQPRTITVSGEEVIWGTVTDTTSAYTDGIIEDGEKVASMEWFYAGERGDQYRMVGYPNVIHTEYFADTSAIYNFIDIDYYFEGDGMNSTKSNKSITLAIAEDSSDETKIVRTNAIITAIRTAVPSVSLSVLA